jgi:uncharacterized protein (TIGR00369 family)
MEASKPANPDFRQVVEAVVLTMPAAKHLGFEFSRIEPGSVELVQPFREELTTHDGSFQAGVLGALADFAGGSAAGTLLPEGWLNLTIDYTVKVLAPAKGDRLVVRARIVSPGRTISVAAADVYAADQGEETLCATALVTMRNVKVPSP